MAKFLNLTTLSGAPVTINTDYIIKVTPGAARGCNITLNAQGTTVCSIGGKPTFPPPESLCVTMDYAELIKLLP